MAARTLYDKLWDAHVVRTEPDGTTLLYIDRHLVHEVTSPQAFEGLRLAGRTPWRTSSILAVPDHNVPTTAREQGIADPVSRIQVETLDQNCVDFGITEFGMNDLRQGIVHVIGPEQGATLPGMTVVCGDSHTSTHGAFGALAFGIGTWIGLQAFINMAVNMGLLPTKGLTLPLVSYGGSSLLVTGAAIGLLLRIHYELSADGYAGRRGRRVRK